MGFYPKRKIYFVSCFVVLCIVIKPFLTCSVFKQLCQHPSIHVLSHTLGFCPLIQNYWEWRVYLHSVYVISQQQSYPLSPPPCGWCGGPWQPSPPWPCPWHWRPQRPSPATPAPGSVCHRRYLTHLPTEPRQATFIGDHSENSKQSLQEFMTQTEEQLTLFIKSLSVLCNTATIYTDHKFHIIGVPHEKYKDTHQCDRSCRVFCYFFLMNERNLFSNFDLFLQFHYNNVSENSKKLSVTKSDIFGHSNSKQISEILERLI